MKNSLKRELALMSGLLALATVKSKSSIWTKAFSIGAAGFLLSSLRNNFDFKGKKIFITGGSRGLGLSLAWNLLKKGATVTLVARDIAELNRAREILLMYFPKGDVHLSVCDVTESSQLAASIDQAVERMGGIDLLINNAGSILVGPYTSMEKEDYEAQMKLHLYATMETTALVFSHFKSRGGGRILNICSLGGKIAVPHMLPYDTSKFALAGFSQGVTAELAPHNIIVTTAYPTVMRTGSPIQAVFKGNHEKEFLWFETLDNLPLLSMSADTAAKKMLDAVASGSSEIILSIPAKARMMFGMFFPELMNAMMSFTTKLMPVENSSIRKTGSDSASLFNKTSLLRPIQRIAQKEERVYNQRGQSDAEFNMGLKQRRNSLPH